MTHDNMQPPDVEDEPRCDVCGAPVTTGLMAVFCPEKERCEFWPDDAESVAFIERLQASESLV